MARRPRRGITAGKAIIMDLVKQYNNLMNSKNDTLLTEEEKWDLVKDLDGRDADDYMKLKSIHDFLNDAPQKYELARKAVEANLYRVYYPLCMARIAEEEQAFLMKAGVPIDSKAFTEYRAENVMSQLFETPGTPPYLFYVMLYAAEMCAYYTFVEMLAEKLKIKKLTVILLPLKHLQDLFDTLEEEKQALLKCLCKVEDRDVKALTKYIDGVIPPLKVEDLKPETWLIDEFRTMIDYENYKGYPAGMLDPIILNGLAREMADKIAKYRRDIAKQGGGQA